MSLNRCFGDSITSGRPVPCLILFHVINCSYHRCFGDSRTPGGPIVALFYSLSLTDFATGVLETAEHQEDPLWPCFIPFY